MGQKVLYTFENPRTRKRSSRGRWELICLRRGSDGSTRNMTKLTDVPCSPKDGTGERRAKALIEGWIEELKSDELVRRGSEVPSIAEVSSEPPVASNLDMTLAEYGEMFNDRRVRRGEIELSTATDWMGDFRRYCLAGMRDGITVREVTHEDVTAMIDHVIHSRGLAAPTARRGFLALNQLMKEAVTVDDLPRNPCASIKAPKKGFPRQNPLSVRKASALVRTLMAMRMTRTVFTGLCALMFGISEGEICGLQLGSVDLTDTRSILIRRAIGRNGNSTYVKDPKTPSRRRRIFLTETMAELIKLRIEEMSCECREAGTRLTEEHYLVGGPDGSYWTPSNLSKHWTRFSESLGLRGMEGLRLTFHDLRHTFATCANAAGMDVSTIAHIMGHSKETVALMIYISVDPEETVGALAQLEERYNVAEAACWPNPSTSSPESGLEALGVFSVGNCRA